MDEILSFGYWLRRRRKALDMTQAELGRRVNASTGTIRKIEADERRPSRELSLLLANQLAVPQDEHEAFVRATRTIGAVKALVSLQGNDHSEAGIEILTAWNTYPDAVSKADKFQSSVHSNLPAPATKFVGREMQLQAIADLLTRTDIRLVTIFGTGGVGKTRLALEVARRVADQFKDEILFVSLEAAVSAEDFLDRLMLALGIQRTPAITSQDAILAFLRESHALMILDTFENLLSSAAFLGEILQSAPDIKLMVTSRAVLHLAGENVFAVPMMAGRYEHGDLAAIAQREDVSLFIIRTQTIWPDFELNSDNVDDVLAICQLMDGLPLALELSAARTRLLALPELRLQLEHNSDLLAGGPLDAPLRQHSIQNTISWSHDLLTPDEQLLLRRMSVYRDGCTLAAAQAIAPRQMLSNGRFLDVLTGLLDHSLISIQKIGSQHLYRMHDLTRQFALSQVVMFGELDVTMSRLLDFVSGPAEWVEHHAQSSKSYHGLDLFDQESNNVWLVLEWGAKSSEVQIVEKCLRLCGMMLHYWNLRGYVDLARKWTERTLERAKQLGIQTTSQTHALLTASALALIQADSITSSERSEAALVASREIGDQAAEALALHLFGLAAYYQGDLTKAEEVWTSELDVAEQLGNGSAIAKALDDLGNLVSRQGDYEAALKLHQREQEVSRDAGDLYSEFYAVLNLGDVSIRLHRLQEAERFSRRALEISRQMGDVRGLAHTLITQSRLFRQLNRQPEVNQLLREALELSWQIQNFDIVLTALEQMTINGTELSPSVQAQLLGLYSAQRGRYGPSSYQEDEVELEKLSHHLKQQLGLATFDQEFLTGRDLPWEAAVNLGLQKAAFSKPVERENVVSASTNSDELD